MTELSKLQRGDRVVVKLSDNEKGKKGTIVTAFPRRNIQDDCEREQLMEETSQKQKVKLLNTVNPLMNTINQFLDSFGDEPLSHEAILLGNLAELISELQIASS